MAIINDYHTMKDEEEYVFCRTKVSEKRNRTPFMGFELEVDAREYVDLDTLTDDTDNIMNTDFDFIHYERDCSLNRGFENISQPASLEYHISMREKYEKWFKLLVDNGLRSHNTSTCGLHIHIDNEFLGSNYVEIDRAQAKLVFLFERFSDELTKFSRRKSSQLHWCDTYSECFDDIREAVYKIKSKSGEYDDSEVTPKDAALAYRACRDKVDDKDYDLDRYYNVNLTNSDTTEIRLWRGTLNINTFMATIKFTARLAKLAETTSTYRLTQMTWEEVLGDDKDILNYWETVKNREI